jgi:phosphoglycolate phosphatase
MANVHFGPRPFAAELVIFDKDGTLIDFAHLWAAKTVAAVEALVGHADAALRRELYATLGYDPDAGRFAVHSPVLTAPVSKLHTIAAAVLYRYGWGWLAAELLVEAHFAPAMDGAFDAAMVRPTADLPALLGGLTDAGVKLAVITSDDHAPTATALEWLGVTQYVGFVVGADDPYPHKPAPEAVWAVCRRLGADPTATALVGDSTTDLEMARRAGVGLRVGVCSGLMDAATLAPHADVVLASVGAIRC